jgi:hypothetical protein
MTHSRVITGNIKRGWRVNRVEKNKERFSPEKFSYSVLSLYLLLDLLLITFTSERLRILTREEEKWAPISALSVCSRGLTARGGLQAEKRDRGFVLTVTIEQRLGDERERERERERTQSNLLLA